MNDETIARKYVSKAQQARDKGYTFNLSFTSFKNLMRAKKCAYTGIPFSSLPSEHRTIDRIDNTKGYVSGNVVACLHSVNYVKSIWENPNNPLGLKDMLKIIKRTQKEVL